MHASDLLKFDSSQPISLHVVCSHFCRDEGCLFLQRLWDRFLDRRRRFDVDENTELIKSKNWAVESIYSGITYGQHKFSNLFSSNQSISVIDIDLNNAPVEIDFPWTSSRELTSKLASDANAICAVNGTFFDVTNGGSVEYFKKDNIVVAETTDPDHGFRDEAALSLKSDGTVEITAIPSSDSWNEYYTNTSYKSMISAGPWILDDGDSINYESVSFNTKRHPRTFVGLTLNNHLKLVTVDGRSSGNAEGMSIGELQTLASALDCYDALNFDGGGSTTMWIDNKPFNGVVNYPTDNGKHDHVGERSCANIIAVFPDSSLSSRKLDSEKDIYIYDNIQI